MQADSSKHALALEYLFLFHACKLTNHRPDQSVCQSDVARAAGLSQEQTEHICASLREARLIRFSSLLGDISATRFGVSELVTTKACPNSGANYFPALRQMGLRFSRGHHLFDELELVWATRIQDEPELHERPNRSSQPDSGRARQLPISGFTNTAKKPANIHNSSTQQIRQDMIDELEQLLKDLQPATATTETIRKTVHHRLSPQPGQAPSPTGPSLLLNPLWTRKGGVLNQPMQPVYPKESQPRQESQPLKQHATSDPQLDQDQDSCNHGRNSCDVSTDIDNLSGVFNEWCQSSVAKNIFRFRTYGLIEELVKIESSLEPRFH